MVATPHDTLDELGELTGAGYFRVDADRNVVEVSRSLLEVTGMSREEVVGRPCIGLIRCSECLKGCEVFRRGRVDNARVSVYRKDGSSIEVVRSGRLLRDEQGKPAGAVETYCSTSPNRLNIGCGHAGYGTQKTDETGGRPQCYS